MKCSRRTCKKEAEDPRFKACERCRDTARNRLDILRFNRARRGLCHKCNRPRTRGIHCDIHHSKVRERYAATHPMVKQSSCSNCLEPGHNSRTCTEPPQ